MAHCPFEKLEDLEKALSTIRSWEGIKEVKPGVFYLKRIPFLHFHEKEKKRWADMRSGKNWGAQVDIPFGAKPSDLTKFLKVVEQGYKKTFATNL